jgi:hypothetical protein
MSEATNALRAALAGEDDLEKGLSLFAQGDPMQTGGAGPNGGFQFGEDDEADEAEKSYIDNPEMDKAYDEGDDDEDFDDEDEDEEGDDDEDDMEKSLRALLSEDDLIAKSLDAAPVLEALVDGLDEVAEGLRGELRKGLRESAESSDLIARGLVSVIEAQRELSAMVKSLSQTFEAIAGKPVAPPRSQRPAHVLEKGMGATAQAPALNADMVGAKLLRGIQAGKIDPVWAHRYETQGKDPAKLPADILSAIQD